MMPPKEPPPLAHMEEQWTETGQLPSALPHPEQLSDQERQHYRRLMLLERTLQPSSQPLSERTHTPSPAELERGFQRVWEQLQSPQAEESAAEQERAAPAISENPPALQEPLADKTEKASSGDQSGSGLSWLWQTVMTTVREALAAIRSWRSPVWVGVGVILLVVTLWRGQTDQQNGAWQKGKTTLLQRTGPQHIQLQFGLSQAQSNQPEQRGSTGIKVQAGQWLYFWWSKDQTPGYIYLLRYQARRPALLLYPTTGQSSYVKPGKRSWLMAHRGVALRYQVPQHTGTIGFVGILSQTPLTQSQLKALTKDAQPTPSMPGMLRHPLKILQQPRQWVDGFVIHVRSHGN